MNNQNNSIITTTISLNLYKILNSLILSILNTSSTNSSNITLPDLSNYFINSLYSNLNLIPSSSNNNYNLTLLSDSLIDVIWQLDQDLESGLINCLIPVIKNDSLQEEGMEIIETESSKEAKKKSNSDLIIKLERDARLKLSELVKRLTVRSSISLLLSTTWANLVRFNRLQEFYQLKIV